MKSKMGFLLFVIFTWASMACDTGGSSDDSENAGSDTNSDDDDNTDGTGDDGDGSDGDTDSVDSDMNSDGDTDIDSNSDDSDSDTSETLELTCDVLSDEAFCWKNSVAAVHECVNHELRGVFNIARTDCTFPDDVVIKFTNPLPDQLDMVDVFEFTIETADGQTCAHLFDADGELRLTTSEGPFVDNLIAPKRIEMTCPSGEHYATDNAWDLSDCVSELPGMGYGLGASLSFKFLGASEKQLICDFAQ